MVNKEKPFTVITHESTDCGRTILEFDRDNLSAEDYIQAMVTIMISATFHPVTIFRNMFRYSKDSLEAMGENFSENFDE